MSKLEHKQCYCVWEMKNNVRYITGCNNGIEFDGSSTVEENFYTYCPYCGLEIWDKDLKESDNG